MIKIARLDQMMKQGIYIMFIKWLTQACSQMKSTITSIITRADTKTWSKWQKMLGKQDLRQSVRRQKLPSVHMMLNRKCEKPKTRRPSWNYAQNRLRRGLLDLSDRQEKPNLRSTNSSTNGI